MVDQLVDDLAVALQSLPPAVDDAARIDRIRSLEQLKGAVAAVQATETAAFAASQRAAQRAAGVPAARVGRGVAAQVALARRESPFRATRYVGWATILTTELPSTYAALRRGHTSEWRAMLVARETAWLSRADRARVDDQIAPRLTEIGDRRVEAETKTLAYRLDPSGYVDRLRAAESERRVTLRPAPETMSRLGSLLPVAQGVAAYAALGRAADSARAAGDQRSRGQIMADTLVERVTGQASAPAVPVEVHLVMTDGALLGEHAPDPDRDGDEPAELLGYGPIPAEWAREVITSLPAETPAWIRRLYRHPVSRQLAEMDSTRRTFTAAQRRFVRIRDHDTCRTPYCGAPIRHIDHVDAAADGGATSVRNAEGLCEACNYAKQAVGWASRVVDPRDGTVEIRTPTGHVYSHGPPSGGAAGVGGGSSPPDVGTASRIAALIAAGRLSSAA